MNIDELVENIRKVSTGKVVHDLTDIIQQWKSDENNVIDLKESIERYLGNTWIDKQSDFDNIYGSWSDFKDAAIEGIGGMTMNERLYWFGLFDSFDNASNESERQRIYTKLMAKK